MPSLVEVTDAFDLLFRSLIDKSFQKTKKFDDYNEQKLLPLTRAFLLGYFRRVEPEVEGTLHTSYSGRGRIDFRIDNVAVEFAVRRRNAKHNALSDVTNASEIIKLARWSKLSVLVLFDFSGKPFDQSKLEGYRSWRSLDAHRSEMSPFNIRYFYLDREAEHGYKVISMNISPKRRQPRTPSE